MLSPNNLKQSLPPADTAASTVAHARAAIRGVLSREDHRLLVIVGPCSIHDSLAAEEYAQRLAHLNQELGNDLLLVMRTYFEKPRTTIGWRGLIADPELDGSCDMARGVSQARNIMRTLNDIGVACATESLDTMLVGYTEDLVSWTAIGARTCESQIHRAMASGLPMPVGFKNGTNGQIDIAIDALETAACAQSYLSSDNNGCVTIARSTGNPDGHVILRGGTHGPNFAEQSVQSCEQSLHQRGLPTELVIDCSHANSAKQPRRQLEVLANVSQQITHGNHSIVGVMVESHLHEGNQPLTRNKEDLTYGVSITDPCLGWDDTAEALRHLQKQLGQTLRHRQERAKLSDSHRAA